MSAPPLSSLLEDPPRESADGTPGQEGPFTLTLFYVVTLYSLYSILIPRIVSLVVALLCGDSEVERQLYRQIADFKQELRSLNIMDEFAKYSKIERKLIKAEDELKSKNRDRFIYSSKIKIALYVVLYAISAITTIVLHWNYYYRPVLIFPEKTLYPFGWILAFPTGRNDCVSVLTWSFISSYVFKTILS